jgi:hypothetical protein
MELSNSLMEILAPLVDKCRLSIVTSAGDDWSQKFLITIVTRHFSLPEFIASSSFLEHFEEEKMMNKVFNPNRFSISVIKSSSKYFFPFGHDCDHEAALYSLGTASPKVLLLMKVTLASSHNLHDTFPYSRRLDGWIWVWVFSFLHPHTHLTFDVRSTTR